MASRLGRTKVKEGQAVAKMRARKKRSMMKVGHRKLANGKSERKRLPKLRLPRNIAGKMHVIMMVHMLNSFTDTKRAECLNALAKYLPKKPTIQFTNRPILTKQSRDKLVKKIVKLMAE